MTGDDHQTNNCDKILWNNLVEAGKEVLELVLDGRVQPILS